METPNNTASRLPVVLELSKLAAMVQTYRERGLPVMFDTETTDLDPFTLRPVSLQFKQLGFPPVVVDVRHADLLEVSERLAPLFDGALLVVGHNLKFDWKVMKVHFNIEMQRMFDTMLAEKILDGGFSENRQFNLRMVAERYKLSVSKEEREWFYDLDLKKAWDDPFPEEELWYMGQDVLIPETIFQYQNEKLVQRRLVEVAKLEFDYIKPCACMELHGILVDEVRWREFIKRKEQEAAEAEQEVIRIFKPAILARRTEREDAKKEAYDAWEAALHLEAERLGCKPRSPKLSAWRKEHPRPPKPEYSEEVNINSHDQMVEAFQVMGIPATSCKEEDLKLLEDAYPALKVYSRYKKKRKLVDSFGERFLAYRHPVTGRIHTSFNQIIDTGRMSSSEPNIQQIPARGDDGKEMRSMIIAPVGYKLIVNDYPGIEDRILCYLSQDENKLRIFRDGLDPHTETARMLFGIEVQDGVVTQARYPEVVGMELDRAVRMGLAAFNGKCLRDVAKQLNYGLMYGMSAQRLARTLNIELKQAEEVYAEYFKVYDGVHRFLLESREQAIHQRESHTILGRVRRFSLPEEPQWPHENLRQARAEYKRLVGRVGRQGANARIQGTSADITKRALCLLYERLPKEVKIIMAIHDEIVLEAPEELAEYAAAILETSMEDACAEMMPGFPVPCDGAVIADYWKKG